jgi:hypothetical protein
MLCNGWLCPVGNVGAGAGRGGGVIPVDWSHGQACSGIHSMMLAQTSPLDADASRFWERDPDFTEWLDVMERQDDAKYE